MYQTILWDFNGTILDDVGIGIDAINAILASRNLPPIPGREEYRDKFRFPIIDYYADLGFDVSEYDVLAVEWVEQYLKRAPLARTQTEVVNVIKELHQKGVCQGILSASEQKQLARQAKELGIDSYFTYLLGLDNIHATSKVELAKEFQKRENPGKTVIIGDTDHDAKAAKAIGADCILLSIGHQSRERLLLCGVKVIDDPKELLSYLLSE